MDDKKTIEAINKWPWTRTVYPVQTATDRSHRRVTLLSNADDVSLVTAGMDAHHPFAYLAYEIIHDADGFEKQIVAEIERAIFE